MLRMTECGVGSGPVKHVAALLSFQVHYLTLTKGNHTVTNKVWLHRVPLALPVPIVTDCAMRRGVEFGRE